MPVEQSQTERCRAQQGAGSVPRARLAMVAEPGTMQHAYNVVGPIAVLLRRT